MKVITVKSEILILLREMVELLFILTVSAFKLKLLLEVECRALSGVGWEEKHSDHGA